MVMFNMIWTSRDSEVRSADSYGCGNGPMILPPFRLKKTAHDIFPNRFTALEVKRSLSEHFLQRIKNWKWKSILHPIPSCITDLRQWPISLETQVRPPEIIIVSENGDCTHQSGYTRPPRSAHRIHDPLSHHFPRSR